MGTPQRRLLFIKAKNSSFVMQDEEMLRRHFRVESFEFGGPKGFGMVVMQWRLLLWLVPRLRKSAGCLVWFADYHAFFPAALSRLYHRKCLVVVGGYDADRDQALNYGASVSPIRRWVVRLACTAATHLLPVSSYTEGKLLTHVGSRLRRKSTIVHNALGASFSLASPHHVDGRKKVLCVAIVEDNRTQLVKGIDYFMGAARQMPGTTFTLVGVGDKYREHLEGMAPPNLELVGRSSREGLQAHYHSAAALCVLSRKESFGLVALEAIASGCPVVTFGDLGTAEIISNSTGVIVQERSIPHICEGIRRAMSLQLESASIQETISRFSMEHRERAILNLLNSG